MNPFSPPQALGELQSTQIMGLQAPALPQPGMLAGKRECLFSGPRTVSGTGFQSRIQCHMTRSIFSPAMSVTLAVISSISSPSDGVRGSYLTGSNY